MAELELPSVGTCRCGDVQLRVSAAPILTMACHCKGCQRMSASAYSLSAAIPKEGFAVTRGEPVIGGMQSVDLKHYFCPRCMTWMYTQFVPELVNVRITMFDALSWLAPFIETYTKAKLPWVTTPAVHRYAEFPPAQDFGMLTEEFAAWLQQQPDREAG